MRIDHFAYQRATRVAALGFGLQLLIGLTLLIFGITAGDTSLIHGGFYALPGIFIWLSLIVVFNQHKLERLEALESDELQQQRMAGLASAFDSEAAEFNVAARRLQIMHRWLMPIMSWLMIVLLGGVAALVLWLMSQGEFSEAHLPQQYRGWALGILLLLAVTAFIFSRFVAGMSRQPAWQNLRGGAGYMVGNALVTLAVATGITFQYFDKFAVSNWVSKGILIFMMVFAAEILLNFILNLYRPRRAGETPRPAFDSRLLSLLSAPDSIVRSINEAINYQFGFDITSSWGYQLLLRAAWKLAAVGVILIIVLNSIVVVEPHQQAVRLRGGEIVGGVHGAGLMFKLPWPFETAEVHDVDRVRVLPLTPVMRLRVPQERLEPVLWAVPVQEALGFEPFLVRTRPENSAQAERIRQQAQQADESFEALAVEPQEERAEADAAVERIASDFALVEGEFALEYRIRGEGGEGLRQFLNFSSDHMQRRQPLEMRERALKSLALRELTNYLSGQDLDRIVSEDRVTMLGELRDRIQQAFDAHETGVEVLAVINPWLRPAGEAAKEFERLAYNIVTADKTVAEARRLFNTSMIQTVGSPEAAERIIRMIDEFDALSLAPVEPGEEAARDAELAAREVAIEQAIMRGGGDAAGIITRARTDLWSRVLLADARLEMFKGRLLPYRAGPEVYRQFLYMETLEQVLSPARKYFVGIDPESLLIDIDILADDSAFAFTGGTQTNTEEGSQ